jgi:hypothetical protein
MNILLLLWRQDVQLHAVFDFDCVSILKLQQLIVLALGAVVDMRLGNPQHTIDIARPGFFGHVGTVDPQVKT